MGNEKVLCTLCRYSLPVTDFHKSPGNPVEQLFWGRIKIEHATSLLFFEKESPYRNLVHQLKYSGRKEVGIWLGEYLGSQLKESCFGNPDVLIPVPLHKVKLRRRGFNQCEVIARGISNVTNLPVVNNAIRRKVYTTSQTKKGRYNRWKNVEGVFECTKPELLKGKHVLLIDDVVTTGSTLEAAAFPLTKIPGVKISVATLAYAN